MKTKTFRMQKLFTYFAELPEADLVTREIGAKAYDSIRQEFSQMASGMVLIFNFTGVLVMDSSFTGPSLLRLMRELIEGQFGDRYLALSRVNSSTKENIDLTIRGHGLKLAIPLIEKDSPICLLGEIEPNLKNTFDIVNHRKNITARDLADLEGIGISAASNRLKKLYDLRLITRNEEITSEGRRHRYQILSA